MYDERFKGQGFDRIQQICELYVAGFTMLLLDNAFVIHDGFKEILKKKHSTALLTSFLTIFQ